jgi:hypothetical protein
LLGVWRASGKRKEPPGHKLRHSLISGAKLRTGTNSRICTTTLGVMGFSERSNIESRGDDKTAWARASAPTSTMPSFSTCQSPRWDFPLRETARPMAPASWLGGGGVKHSASTSTCIPAHCLLSRLAFDANAVPDHVFRLSRS